MEPTQNNWLSQAVITRKCPKCKHGNLNTRVPRGFWMKHILRKDVKRYQCDACSSRIYVK